MRGGEVRRGRVRKRLRPGGRVRGEEGGLRGRGRLGEERGERKERREGRGEMREEGRGRRGGEREEEGRWKRGRGGEMREEGRGEPRWWRAGARERAVGWLRAVCQSTR